MKKFNRTVGLFLSAVMLAAAVSGCGAKETADTTDAVASETTGKAAPAGEMSRVQKMWRESVKKHIIWGLNT